jgi:hypothetical protein
MELSAQCRRSGLPDTARLWSVRISPAYWVSLHQTVTTTWIGVGWATRSARIGQLDQGAADRYHFGQLGWCDIGTVVRVEGHGDFL